MARVISVGGINESLGAMKLSNWLRDCGWNVSLQSDLSPLFDNDADLYCFSVVFSWDLPRLVEMARLALRWGEVWIGGPAVSFSADNAEWVFKQTGIRPVCGIDDRFEEHPGDYPMVYFSRGCPAYTPACGLCPVPKIEGNTFRFYRNAKPAALLLDNNLSALPETYQQEIIDRYRSEWRGGLVDANSGFEPHSFDSRTLKRWEKFPLRYWRFGYDDTTEREQALEMMNLLRSAGFSGEKVRVYTLIGNEPIEECHQRIREVINNGFHPWPQRLRPLNWRSGPLPCRHDWDEPTLIAFQRFYSIAGLWKRLKPEEFFYQGRFPLSI